VKNVLSLFLKQYIINII